jgi:competence protein ComGC
MTREQHLFTIIEIVIGILIIAVPFIYKYFKSKL